MYIRNIRNSQSIFPNTNSLVPTKRLGRKCQMHIAQCHSKRFLETHLYSSSGHGDYRMLFYTVFGCVVSSWILAMLILDFNVKSPSAKRHRGGLSKVLFSRALLVYLTMFFFNGFIDGVRQSYVNVDLEDNLGASSKLLGILQNICKHLLGSCYIGVSLAAG